MAERLRVRVVHATPGQAWDAEVELPAGATVADAIAASGLREHHPALATGPLEVGIFHRICEMQAPVRDGDRIEVLRPLRIDPKEARRLRARRSGTPR